MRLLTLFKLLQVLVSTRYAFALFFYYLNFFVLGLLVLLLSGLNLILIQVLLILILPVLNIFLMLIQWYTYILIFLVKHFLFISFQIIHDLNRLFIYFFELPGHSGVKRH